MTDTADKSNDHLAELHLRLQDMLAGYVDGELEPDEQVLVEAHLAGCRACREDVQRQQLLHRHLGRINQPSLSAAQHRHLDTALAAAPATSARSSSALRRHLKRWFSVGWGDRRFPLVAATGGWLVAVALLIIMLWPAQPPTGSQHIPMVRDVLTEYARVAHDNLPVSSPPKTVAPPATWPSARLVTTWRTTVGGAPAQAFAMRSGNGILLQFRVDDHVFFNNPRVRAAVASSGKYETREKNLKVLALPLREGGVLLVGPDDQIPPVSHLLTRL